MAKETQPVSSPSYTPRQLRPTEATALVRGTQGIHGGAAALGILGCGMAWDAVIGPEVYPLVINHGSETSPN